VSGLLTARARRGMLCPRPAQTQSANSANGLIAKAQEEPDPERLKIFLLAVMAGLRRKEIDLLEWKSLRFAENVIRIEPTEFFHPKKASTPLTTSRSTPS
jgi:hypothetical protein